MDQAVKELWGAVDELRKLQTGNSLSLARIEEQNKAQTALINSLRELLDERCKVRGMELCTAKGKIKEHDEAIAEIKRQHSADSAEERLSRRMREAVLIFIASMSSGGFFWVLNNFFK